MFICRQKINFIPHALLEILQRYANFLFWVLWTCLVAHTQNDSINLYKTLMFICMQKTNFIIHFFLEILHFKESCNLIGWQQQQLEFCQIWDWWWSINSNISIPFRLFLRKTNDKILKRWKRTYFRAILGPFYQNLGKNEFSWKKEHCQFLDIPIIYQHAKKKTIVQFLSKTQNWGTDRPTDRKTDRRR